MSDRPSPTAGARRDHADILVVLMHWLGALPLGAMRQVGAVLGLLAYLCAPGYRRKIRAHLRLAGYPSGRAARRAAAEAGRMAGELPFIWTRAPGQIAGWIECDDLAVLEAAEAAGRGVVYLTPHLGSFEVTARFLANRAPITVLFKPPSRAWLRPLLDFSRNTGAMRAVPATLGGVRAMLRALRAGEAIGLLPDQVPSDGDGRWAPFFGQPAYTMTLPQRLAQHPGVQVVITAGERLRGGRGWRVHFEAMSEAPTPEAINARMEALIRRFPAQYLWSYNRYKRPRAADLAQ